MNNKWFLYIIRCKDNSLYTGITTDINRRFLQHKEGKGAKYTRAKGVLKIESIFSFENRSLASKEEIRIKKLSKNKKEEIILSNPYLYNEFDKKI